MSKELTQEVLGNKNIDVAFINITQTQLNKAIIDATKPVRELLKRANIHDYATQEQGGHAKVTKRLFYLEDMHTFPSEERKAKNEGIEEKVSLYKPPTKKGDPRIWLTNLKKHVVAGDVLAIITEGTELYAFNVENITLVKAFIEQNPFLVKTA